MQDLFYGGADLNFGALVREYNHFLNATTRPNMGVAARRLGLINTEARLAGIINYSATNPNLNGWLTENATLVQAHIDLIQRTRANVGLARSPELEELKNSLYPPTNWKSIAIKSAMGMATSYGLYNIVGSFWNKGATTVVEKGVEESIEKVVENSVGKIVENNVVEGGLRLVHNSVFRSVV